MNLAAPSSQKADARPISFVLDDQAFGSAPVSLNLAIRPEELSRTDVSRVNVQQTLGGAWADNFGPGIPQITLAGTTGWRRTAGGNQEDGGERFATLFDTVFTQWHDKRKQAVQSGLDPDKVKLVFADALDNFAVVVAPISFVLRRSKSRPLLHQFQIALTVLDQNVDQLAYLDYGAGVQVNSASGTQGLGLDSLSASIDQITSFESSINQLVQASLVAPVRDFMGKTAKLYGSVLNAVQGADAIAGSLITIAQMTAQTGYNVFRTLAAVAGIPTHVKGQLMQIGAAYTNIWCVLKNALQLQKYAPDYTPVFGSSNCSSTSGGRPLSPLANVNPFYLTNQSSSALPVSISPTAQTAMGTIGGSDPVTNPLSTSSMTSLLNTVSQGFSAL